MRAVIDTNVFVSALLQGAVPRRVYTAFLRGHLTPVFSGETLAELIDVLARPPLRILMHQSEIDGLLTLIQRDALLVRPTHHLRACRDPKDNMLLECALAGRADCIVTGDEDLLTLHPFHGLPILRPTDFLRWLSSR